MTTTPASAESRMPQLDGLRAFAVTAVAVSHWTPDFLAGIVPWGTGVQLFFVLSGFLITGILLRSRPAELGIGLGEALRVFYARRVLRIFPIYYAVLAFAWLFSVGPIETTWPWHVSYLSNFHYALHGHGTALEDPFLHFWSLGVEEQFYLAWPLIVLVLGRRAIVAVLFACVGVSMAFRVGIDHLVPSIVSVRYLTPSCLDAFAVGGLVAHARHYHGPEALRRAALVLAIVGAAGLVVSVVGISRLAGGLNARHIGHTFLVIFYGAIVAKAADGFGSVPGKILEFRPVLYLGRISYGLYVYHYFAPLAVRWLGEQTGWVALQQQGPLTLAAYAVFTVLVAVGSWHLYETPINRLKRRFEYPRGAVVRTDVRAKVAPAVPSV